MKRLFFFFILTYSIPLTSQSHELNIGTGFAQYAGDLNVSNKIVPFFNPKNFKFSAGAGYRYNFEQRFSIGLSYNYLQLAGYDSDNKSNGINDDAYFRLVRNLSFTSEVHQIFADFRYEPLRLNDRWNKEKWHSSPYISAGIGGFKFNPKTMYMGNEVELQPLATEGQGAPGQPEKYSLTQVCIPVGFGFKFTEPKRRFGFSIDFNYSFLFTDYLDDVSTVYATPATIAAANAGNPTQAAMAIALANRNYYGISHPVTGVITSPGQIRGNPDKNDGFLTGQIRFVYFISSKMKGAYYKCCGF